MPTTDYVDPDATTQPMPEIDVAQIDSSNINYMPYDPYQQQGPARGTKVAPTIKGEKLTVLQNADRWKNRRRMAYMALLGMFVATGLLFFVVEPKRIEVLQEPIVWFYIAMTSIVGGYIGFSAWDNVRGGR
jgi:hypothetical protein